MSAETISETKPSAAEKPKARARVESSAKAAVAGNGDPASVTKTVTTTARSRKGAGKGKGKKPGKQAKAASARKRGRKPYPVAPFADVIVLGEAIMKHNAGQPVKRTTLLKKMGLDPTASSTRNLITNSNKYGITEGHHSAETLKLTTKGSAAVNPKASTKEQKRARFDLAIGDVAEFNALFEKRKGNNMPSPEMLHDDLHDVDEGDRKPCADVFTSNVKFLGLLTDRDGAQYLMSLDDWLGSTSATAPGAVAQAALSGDAGPPADAPLTDYDKVCFVMSTINEAGSEQRSHADMILNQYIERALQGTGLRPIRADKIGDPGMISKQIIEYIVHARLVIADLSFHNPNVFYELCLRHVTGKPTVHIIQECDKIPFDLGNFRTIKIDTGDKYKMVSQLDTLRSEIATAATQALANGESRDNPILTFLPHAKFTVGSTGS